MEALKKTGVAAMIMVACLVLAIIIGEVRKPAFENSSNASSSYEQSIDNGKDSGNWLYNISTFGKIKNEIREGLAAINNPTDDADFHFGGKSILIILLVVIVIGVAKKNG